MKNGPETLRQQRPALTTTQRNCAMAFFTIDDLSPRTIRNFWKKVDKDGPGGCWIFTGSCRSHGGYGMFAVRRHMHKAHHVSMAICGNPRPNPAAQGLHNCDNRRCVNPDHLRWGTHKENMADAAIRGRAGRHPNGQKITNAQALEIRTLGGRASIIAKKYGISRSYVNAIRNGRARQYAEIAVR